MPSIPNPHKKVPMMFRAQVRGRCQVQGIDPARTKQGAPQDVQLWASEWTWQVYEKPPQFGPQVQVREYEIAWRLMTNSGQDDTIIRPAIGWAGWPFYSGSACKGLFRRACTAEQAMRFCGGVSEGGLEPGILRFHGGYPTDASWQNQLEDIVHPQQIHQVGMRGRKPGAFAAISLYRPKMRFGISVNCELLEADWREVWGIWEKAIAMGLGGRTCAGYGQVKGALPRTGKLLFRGTLRGQGAAAKLLDGTGEFRPNGIRAAVRGHALRIFGGLAGAEAAMGLVQELFGGVQGGATLGLLGMEFEPSELEMGRFGEDRYRVPTYEVTGELRWRLVGVLPEAELKALQRLLVMLTRFAVLLGGIGKSWRRADHRLFFKEYYPNWSQGKGEDRKALIGCHWEWADGVSLRGGYLSLNKIGSFIDLVRGAALTWMELRGVARGRSADWREAWGPRRVQMWGRLARNPVVLEEECLAAKWLHGPYRGKDFSIARTGVTGGLSLPRERQVGRLWHRMYPVARPEAGAKDVRKANFVKTKNFYELLTLFGDGSEEFADFVEFLGEKGEFERLWPIG